MIRQTRLLCAHFLLEDFDPEWRIESTECDVLNNNKHLLRRPDVPGFWPSNGLVGISFDDMADE